MAKNYGRLKPCVANLSKMTILGRIFTAHCFLVLGAITNIACGGSNTQELLDARFIVFPSPYIDTVLVTQYNRIVVTFNEKVTPLTATNKENYSIVDANGAALAVGEITELNGSAISFQITTGIQLSNREYSVSASNVKTPRGVAANSTLRKKFIGYNSTGAGVFVDNGNGTVYSSGMNITWAKCSQDNTAISTLYNAATNDCSGGSGVIGTFAYCPANDNSCNGAVTGQNLDGGGISPLYNACAALNSGSGFAGKKTWRVPTYAEIVTIVVINSNPAINATLFPGTASAIYWTATSATSNQAWIMSFINGTNSFPLKSSASHARCVYSGS